MSFGLDRRRRRLALLAAFGLTLAALGAACGGGAGASQGSSSTGSQTGTTGGVETADTSNPHPVAGNFERDGTALEDCRKDGGAPSQSCLEQAFGNLAFDKGAEVAMARFAADIAADPTVESGCHRIAHAIGSASLARNKGDVGRAFTQGDSTCWSGYYHGILERALKTATSDVLLEAAIKDLCQEILANDASFIAYQCVHGLGHGLMIHTGLDLRTSLEFCEKLATSWEQTSCDGGVFMENYNTSYGVKSSYLKDDDPIYPCNAIAERHKLYCYLQVTDRILELNGFDFGQAATTCETAEANWRATCFQSLGRSASGNARLDRDQLDRYCGTVTEMRWRVECVYGAVRDITSQDAAPGRALAYCDGVETDAKPRCYYGIGTIVSGFDRKGSQLARACAKAPSSYRTYCRQEATGEL